MKKQLVAQLEKEGISATYTVSDFDLLRGLILSEVTVFETEKKQVPLLSLSRIAVNYDLIRTVLSFGGTGVHLTMNDSDLSLFEGDEVFVIEGMNTDMWISRNRLRLEEFKAEFRDVQMDFRADVEFDKLEAARKRYEKKAKEARPKKEETSEEEKPDKKRKNEIDLAPVIEILRQIPDSPDGQLLIRMACEFHGWAKIPEVVGQISGNQFSVRGITFDDISVPVTTRDSGMGDPFIQFDEAGFRVGNETCVASGFVNPFSEVMRLESLTSSINPTPILNAFLKKPPKDPIPNFPNLLVTLSGDLDLKEEFQNRIVGKVQTSVPFTVPMEDGTPLTVDSVKSAFSLDKSQVQLSNLEASVRTATTPVAVTGGGLLQLDEKGQPTQVDLTDISIRRNGGRADISGTFFPVAKSMEITKLASNIDFVSVLVDLGLDDPLQGNVSYTAAPEIRLQGFVPFEDPTGYDIQGSLSSTGETIVKMENEQPSLVFRSAFAEAFSFVGDTLTIANLSVEVGEESAPTHIEASGTLLFQKKPLEPGDKIPKLDLTSIVFGPVVARRNERQLLLEGSYEPVSQTLSIGSLQSNLDLMAVLGAFGVPDAMQGKVVFPSPPAISAVGEIPFLNPENIRLKGVIKSDTGVSVPLEGGKSFHVNSFDIPEFTYAGSNISIPQVVATAGPEKAPVTVDAGVDLTIGEGGRIDLSNVTVSRGDRTLSAAASMDLPVTIVNLTTLQSNLDILALLEDFGIGDPTGGKVKFHEPPLIGAAGVFDIATFKASKAAATFAIPAGFSVVIDEKTTLEVSDYQSGECQFSGNQLSIKGLKAVLKAANSPVNVTSNLTVGFAEGQLPTLNFEHLQAVRGDRGMTLTGTLPLETNILSIKSFSSNLEPIGLIKDLGFPDPTLGKVTLNEAPMISAAGSLSFLDPLNQSKLTGRIEAPKGMTIVVTETQKVFVTNLTTAFGVEAGNVRAPDLVAGVFGGTLQANATIRPATVPLPFEAGIRLTAMKLEQITGFFDAGNERTGMVSAEFKGGGTAVVEGVQGAGSIHVSKARLADMPIMRGLRPLLMAINLGEWKENEGDDIKAQYVYDKGTLFSDDVELVGGFYRVGSKMNLDFQTQSLRADGAVSTTGATRVVTGIVGKILEVEAAGSFEDIKWKLKHAPEITSLKDLANLPGDLLKSTLSSAAQPVKLIQGVGGIAKDTLGTAGGVMKDTIDGAAGIGKKIFGGLNKKPTPQPPKPAPVPNSGQPPSTNQ